MFLLGTVLTKTGFTKTSATANALAATAILLTTSTDLRFTPAAIIRARIAAESFASLATDQAIAAENVAAPSAGSFVILAEYITAAGARYAPPIA
jgi:hypothetical protein